MWTTREDAERFHDLTQVLRGVLRETTASRPDHCVEPDDLALYLEWLELAREGATCITPFIDKSSPYALSAVSYQQLANDFQWLGQRLASGLEPSRGGHAAAG